MSDDPCFIPGWTPQQSVVVEFSDETSDLRTDAQLSAMIDELRVVSNRYGFDLSGYATLVAYKRFMKRKTK